MNHFTNPYQLSLRLSPDLSLFGKMGLISALLLFLSFTALSAQCTGFGNPPADIDCSVYPPLTDNMSVGSGQTASICGTSTTVETRSGINLNGGTIRICGDAQITGNFNSGNIVVSCGSTLRFPNGFLFNNNVTVANYGTVIVTGNMFMQNTNNRFYNASPTSRLFVSGDVNTSQNQNQTAYLYNEGYVSIGGTMSLYKGAKICLAADSKMEAGVFLLSQDCGNSDFRFQYPGGTNFAIFRYEFHADLKAIFTNSNRIQVWQAVGSTEGTHTCASWGSAQVIKDADPIAVPDPIDPALCNPQNCYTRLVLPVAMDNFYVMPQPEGVGVQWITGWEENMQYYLVQRSYDGNVWETLEEVPAVGNSFTDQEYQTTVSPPNQELSYYRLKQVEQDGSFSWSEIRSLRWDGKFEDYIQVYPSPATSSLHIQGTNLITEMYIADLQGRILIQEDLSDSPQSFLQTDLHALPAGVYVVGTNLGFAKFLKQ